MTGSPALKVVLCWHMHQPDYRLKGQFLRPWVWLHAIKDYSDMAAHLEDTPGACAVVNFSAILIEQLQDYGSRISSALESGTAIGDPILDQLADRVPGAPASRELLSSLLRVNESTMLNRFEKYAGLHHHARRAISGEGMLSLDQQNDLLVWYVLVWLGESVRTMPFVQRLQQQGRDFTFEDRRELLALIGDVVCGLLPRYQQLQASGKVELSLTPYAHPIMPLLLDMDSARDAMPDAVLPQKPYPGGAHRCDWHVERGIKVFREAFACDPGGCWPSEGGVCDSTLAGLQRHGFHWTASGSRVLFNSLKSEHGDPLLSVWEGGNSIDPNGGIRVFFRDDLLSDKIGFEYSKWPAKDAVDDFVQRLEHRLDSWQEHQAGSKAPVLSIIMDGENAWEYFPENGREFLQLLYSRVGNHPRFDLTTFSRVLNEVSPEPLPGLVAGSWVYGTFSTWVGDAAKNRAWDLLVAAKIAVDLALAPELERTTEREFPRWVNEILRQLAVCEASDWFWWLGDDNRLEDGPEFDRLFREQLAELYALIGQQAPASLSEPINGISGDVVDSGVSGAMRPASM